jgi:dolichol kinase
MSPIPIEHLAPIAHLRIDLFLLGFIAACSFVAALFFLRFWRTTRDKLFLGFAAFFLIECGTCVVVLNLDHPNVGNPWLFLLRLLATLAVLGAIMGKNAARN